MAIYHNGIEIKHLYYNGKKINKIFHNGKCIYTSIAVGESLYDGIPSKGIMLYGYSGEVSSSNPLGIKGDSITLKAPLSSCPNGIKIHFSNTSYVNFGTMPASCRVSDLSIPKGNSSGSSHFSSSYTEDSGGDIVASINGSVLSFNVNNYNPDHGGNFDGTITSADPGSDGYIYEMLAILSITAY